MKSIHYKLADLIIKGLAVAVSCFLLYENKTVIEDNYESRFWDKKLILYLQIVSASSTMATSTFKDSAYENARQRIHRLSIGEGFIVSDEEVQKKLIRFKDFTDSIDAIKVPYNEIKSELDLRNIELAEACQKSIKKFWQF